MITRRCSQRQFLLAPSQYVSQVFLYCLAVAANRTGVLVHAFTVMSNHYHLVVTDPDGVLPKFCEWLNEFVAKALNARYGRWENFWAPEPGSYVRLVNAEDVLAKTVYTLANPVAAGLVSRGRAWPGLRMFSPGRRMIARPDGFFRASGPTPDVATLTVVPPPIGLSSDAAYQRICEAVESHEAGLRAQFQQQGRRFLGVAAVRNQDITTMPTTAEPRRELSPTIACRNKWHRVEILSRCKDFLRRYRNALKAWSTAIGSAVFPPGTYQMVQRYAVPVAPS
jgi:REP element-mobilizing transposase RayT